MKKLILSLAAMLALVSVAYANHGVLESSVPAGDPDGVRPLECKRLVVKVYYGHILVIKEQQEVLAVVDQESGKGKVSLDGKTVEEFDSLDTLIAKYPNICALVGGEAE